MTRGLFNAEGGENPERCSDETDFFSAILRRLSVPAFIFFFSPRPPV